MEDMGAVVYKNHGHHFKEDEIQPHSYTFGSVWKKKNKMYFLENRKTGKIYFQSPQEQEGLTYITLAIKGNVGSRVTLRWNGDPLGDFVIVPFPYGGPTLFLETYVRFAKRGVVFFKYILENTGKINVLEINSMQSDVYCEVNSEGILFFPASKFLFMDKLSDLMEIYTFSNEYLESNRTMAAQPFLHYYIGSIGFLFFGMSYKTLVFMFLGELFLIFSAIQLLIKQEKVSFFIGLFCLTLLFLYLKDYVYASNFILLDPIYVLNFLLFTYFLLKKDFLWCGVYLFLMSLVRFPGYFLGAGYLFLYSVFFIKRNIEQRKIVNRIFAYTFVGVVFFNVIYPSILNGSLNWFNVLYFENIGEEHYSKNYIFSFSNFFDFFKNIFYYTFFMPFLILFRKNKLASFLILSIIPYSLILATVEHAQIHHMFPIVCIWLIGGMRTLNSAKKRNESIAN
ncbi:MAG: hypothetical protein P9X27_00500 [Candidatus Kaelpia aquatica]|nr:hypothetical protein [Candidatus Kaelpia aquatica]